STPPPGKPLDPPPPAQGRRRTGGVLEDPRDDNEDEEGDEDDDAGPRTLARLAGRRRVSLEGRLDRGDRGADPCRILLLPERRGDLLGTDAVADRVGELGLRAVARDD